jgi:hypothetical protein
VNPTFHYNNLAYHGDHTADHAENNRRRPHGMSGYVCGETYQKRYRYRIVYIAVYRRKDQQYQKQVGPYIQRTKRDHIHDTVNVKQRNGNEQNCKSDPSHNFFFQFLFLLFTS